MSDAGVLLERDGSAKSRVCVCRRGLAARLTRCSTSSIRCAELSALSRELRPAGHRCVAFRPAPADTAGNYHYAQQVSQTAHGDGS